MLRSTFLSEEQQQKKKKQKQRQIVLLKQKETERQRLLRLLDTLEELEKEQKYVDVQVCPHCRSPRVKRAGTMSGDVSGHMGLLPVKYECLDCGWQKRLVVNATNKKMNKKHIAIIAEAEIRGQADLRY